MKSERPPLPCPGVRFGPDYLQRVDALHTRLAAVREKREGAGSSAVLAPGEDFVGYRPYSPGEDLRRLDWNLLARLDRPYVQVTRRTAGELWAVLVDTSASMGVGPPGKLQRAAECAVAFACLGQRYGAEVRLFVSGANEGDPVQLTLRPRDDPRTLIDFFEQRVAEGRGGLARLVATPRAYREAGRVLAIGDLLDLEPKELLGLMRGGRELGALQLLAPIELEPGEGAVRWWDPEGEAQLELSVDGPLLARYKASLDARLEGWRRVASRHGIRFACRSTGEAFEDLVRDQLRR